MGQVRERKHNPGRRWLVELTERQLTDVIDCVESIHRFVSGQMELDAATRILPAEQMHEMQSKLRALQPLMTPALPMGASYAWSGGKCPNPDQKDLIARTYPLYRELRHILALDRGLDNVYSGETLTCGHPLPKAKPGSLSGGMLKKCWSKPFQGGMPQETPLLLWLKSGAYAVACWQPDHGFWICDDPDGDQSWDADEVKYWTQLPPEP